MSFPVASLDPFYVLSASLIVIGVLSCGFVARRLPLPPGPKPRFLSGNIHQLPSSDTEPWKSFLQWSKEFGSSIVRFRVYSRQTIVLNTFKAAADLLEVRSNIYSGRPIQWMYQHLVGRGLSVFQISSEHPRFKVYRRLLHSGLNPRKVSEYTSLQERERDILLNNLRVSPNDFPIHFRRNSGAITLELAYGWTVRNTPDRFVAMMEEALRSSNDILQPGKWLVDVLPFLRFIPSWFPGATFQRRAKAYSQQLRQIDMVPHTWAKEQIASGNYTNSFTSQHMLPDDGHAVEGEEEDIIKWCTAALYFGGADTTVAVMTSFVLFMTLYPEIQRRAQAEISQVIGKDRFPSWSDVNHLPYTCAILKEVLRLAPPAPMGIPHRVLRNDEYMSYRIPAGSTVIANIWAMTHDPELYPDPTEFIPERHMKKGVTAAQIDPRKIVFGFGRRVCPGAHLAETSLFLNMASILSAFDILKPLDGHGEEVQPSVEFTSTIISHPKPFKCRIVPRSSSPHYRLDEQ